MTDLEFATELASRMNALIAEPGKLGDVSRLFQVNAPEGHLRVESMLQDICGEADLTVVIEDGDAEIVSFSAA
jgi:hypothetical protein